MTERKEGERKNEVKKCSLCGFCRAGCPVFRVTKNERYSPRGRAILLKKGINDKDVFMKCTLCEQCEKNCPVSVEFDFRKVREMLVKEGKETEANRRMIGNVRKHGNPFGKVEEGKIPDELYCC